MSSKPSLFQKVSLGITVLVVSLFCLFPLSHQDKATAQTTSFTFGAAGDFGGGNSAAAVFDGIKSHGTAFTLGLGDLSYGNMSESSWCGLVQQHLGTTYPFEIIAGNHDSWESTPNGDIDKFISCLPDRLGAKTGNGGYGREYYFDYPATNPIARFIMISPNLTYTNGGYYDYSKGSTHYNWVASTIDNARASGIKWIIVGSHKMCLDTGGYDYDCNTDGMGEDMFNLLLSKKVDLILNGHEHYYGRTKQLALTPSCPAITINGYNAGCVVNGANTGYTKGAGSVEATIGTGGYTMRSLVSSSETPYFAAKAGNLYGYSIFTLSSSQLSMQYYSTTGSFTDSFTISDTGTPAPTVGPTSTPIPTPKPTSSTAGPTSPPQPTPVSGSALRVYTGSSSYTDKDGNVWTPDSTYATGGTLSSTSTLIIGTTDQPLYQHERWGAFSYNFPVQNGTYAVTLKFDEFYFTSPGQRNFNVAINGQPVLSNFDIVAAAGAANTAFDKVFTTNVTNGTVTITFTNGSADDPKIDAVQIVPTNGTITPTPSCTTSMPNGTGTVSSTIHLTAGTYKVWSRMQVPTSGYSYYLQINNGCPTRVSDSTSVNTWDWIASPTTLTIPVDTDIPVKLVGSDIGVKVDEVIFADPACIPIGMGTNCSGTVAATPTSAPPTPTQSVVSATPVPPTPTKAVVPTPTQAVPTPTRVPTPTDVIPSTTPIADNIFRVYPNTTDYTDSTGHRWTSDAAYVTGGSLYSTDHTITGTVDPTLYQSERWGNFTYNFPLQNGTYAVTLKFAEIYFTSVGQRIFNVAINDQRVLTNFDILATAGAPNQAVDETFTTTVTNGNLSITFTDGSADNPKLSALQIIPTTPPPTYLLSGTVYRDSNKNGFKEDSESGYKGALLTLSTGQTTTTDANGNYSFPNLPTASYTLSLKVPDGYQTTTPSETPIALLSKTTQNFGIIQSPPSAPTPTPVSENKDNTPHKMDDLNGDDKINLADLSYLLFKWGTNDTNADLNHNGKVDLADLSILLANWGK